MGKGAGRGLIPCLNNLWEKYFILWEKVLPGRIRFTKN